METNVLTLYHFLGYITIINHIAKERVFYEDEKIFYRREINKN